MGESLSKLLGKQGSKHQNNPFVPNQRVKQVTVWESLNAPLREPKWEKKRTKPCTSTPNKRNFPATPKNVFTISHKDFLAICDKQTKELQGITIAEKDLKVFVTQVDGNGQMKNSASKEGSTSSYIVINFNDIRDFFVDNKISSLFQYTHSDGTEAANAQVDFVIRIAWERTGSIEKIT